MIVSLSLARALSPLSTVSLLECHVEIVWVTVSRSCYLSQKVGDFSMKLSIVIIIIIVIKFKRRSIMSLGRASFHCSKIFRMNAHDQGDHPSNMNRSNNCSCRFTFTSTAHTHKYTFVIWDVRMRERFPVARGLVQLISPFILLVRARRRRNQSRISVTHDHHEHEIGTKSLCWCGFHECSSLSLSSFANKLKCSKWARVKRARLPGHRSGGGRWRSLMQQTNQFLLMMMLMQKWNILVSVSVFHWTKPRKALRSPVSHAPWRGREMFHSHTLIPTPTHTFFTPNPIYYDYYYYY